MFYERMLTESNRLDSQIKELQSKLKQFPPGKLFCTKTDNISSGISQMARHKPICLKICGHLQKS